MNAYTQDTRVQEAVQIAYHFIPPPLSALPAKYHAPISLLLHSLSTALISHRLAEILEADHDEELAYLLGLTHDLHQKLVEDGLASLKKAKIYIKEKLDEIGKIDYYKYVEKALEADACGKEKPVRGMPRSLSTICHIADMAHGRIEAMELLYWLKEKVKSLDKQLTVRFYSVMIPQPFARTYIMNRIYTTRIQGEYRLTLSSPWGLYVITFEDELPEVLEVSWDDLRLQSPIEDYQTILKAEETGKPSHMKSVKASGDELKNRLWSRFARMFYRPDLLGDEPLYPVLPPRISGLFTNISFTDVDFKEFHDGQHTCGLCGLEHPAEYSLVTNMYGKIAGVKVTTEKWNRFMPANIKVKAWDSKGQWKNRIGLCPLCALDAIGVRRAGFARNLVGLISLSISKPTPIELLSVIARNLAYSDSSKNKDPIPSMGNIEERVVTDLSTATLATANNVPEVKTENMFRPKSLLARLGKLVSWGMYPLKFLPSLDTSIIDRPLVTPKNFPLIDFPVTSDRLGSLMPWIGPLLVVAGLKERNEALWALEMRPEHSPLALLILDKNEYDRVSEALARIGVRR